MTTMRPGLTGRVLARAMAVLLGAATLAACENTPDEPTEPPTLVERGRQIFFEETFDGNGRTCGTCHRAEDNFGLSPNFIATLPLEDPLFVAETVDALKSGFEAPAQMRAHGLIRENLDGFEDLENKFTLRGVPHTLALRTSVASAAGPRTGWSGDGAPGDGSLRSFAVGAVIQHFPKTTNRVAGEDFRLPTDAELDALEAFMLSLGRQEELTLPIQFRSATVMAGQALFLDDTVARCNICHFNAGANANPAIAGSGAGNLNFNTGVEDLPNLPSHVVGDPTPPRDDGFGIPGDGTFNTPPLVEAADTGPFFHNNAVDTIEAAVGFYDGDSFNESPAGQFLAGRFGGPIELDATQIQQIAAFLRSINALENIREATALLNEALTAREARAAAALLQTRAEIDDAIEVLSGASLSGDAVLHLHEARRLSASPRRYDEAWREAVGGAVAALERARVRILAPAN